MLYQLSYSREKRLDAQTQQTRRRPDRETDPNLTCTLAAAHSLWVYASVRLTVMEARGIEPLTS